MAMERFSMKVRTGPALVDQSCGGWSVVESRLTMSTTEFRVFVEETEAQLLALFNKIDRDGDGKIDKGELKAAFKRANLAVPQQKLDRFVSEFDRDGSGTITFDEWR